MHRAPTNGNRRAPNIVVFTTIEKFQLDKGNVYKTLSARKNIIDIADEAHWPQYGFKARSIDAKMDVNPSFSF